MRITASAINPDSARAERNRALVAQEHQHEIAKARRKVDKRLMQLDQAKRPEAKAKAERRLDSAKAELLEALAPMQQKQQQPVTPKACRISSRSQKPAPAQVFGPDSELVRALNAELWANLESKAASV